jgi:hypothetical protein
MKLIPTRKAKQEKKENQAPVKSNLESLSQYFGSYLSALEVVSTRR